ncbi:hypothetical protein LT85_0980 [Collimonas arenae]|uniref:Uncharacterized protein n=1 Tax=Collimonas arenae TaxID=279058 RepID=A0A0A1F5Z9_9BURK|nr:hypothetical protein LT85_0980 [Collimonas arenae]
MLKSWLNLYIQHLLFAQARRSVFSLGLMPRCLGRQDAMAKPLKFFTNFKLTVSGCE